MPSGPPLRYRRTGRRWAAREFVRRVYKKAEQDNIFFLAGAIAFNVLVAVLPLILAALGIAGLLLQRQGGSIPPNSSWATSRTPYPTRAWS